MIRRQSGFTLVELLVISPIIMVVTVAAVTFLFNEYGQIVKQDGQLNLQVEAQNILFGLQDDLWYANQFASDMNSNLQDSYQPAGGWRNNTTPPTLIISTASLTTNRRDPNRQPTYINESTCTPPDGNGVNSVLYNNVIYFTSGTNLYKRTITKPSSLATCTTPHERQTCPAANASPSCPTDILLTDHLSNFGVTYYDTGNAVVTTPENAESVKVDITLHDKAYAEDIYANTSMRLRKLNQ
jgi:type II secretory pathway pseudopilin PulG